MYKPRKNSSALGGAHGQSRWLGSEAKDKERGWGFLKRMWHGEGICEALRIPGVGGVEAREKSYHTHWKLEFSLVLGSSSPLRCERCSGAVGQDSKHGKA